jgi:hypothetical protein
MSNISYLTTKKWIKSYDLPLLFQKINQKRFGGKLSISTQNNWWIVEYPGNWDGLDFNQVSPRKLGVKHPHGMWMDYVGVVFRNELGKMTNATLSDEGVEETWKPNPRKYPSYEAWIQKLHSSLKNKNPDLYKQVIQLELSYVPAGMEKY